jgi:hypothetical protein
VALSEQQQQQEQKQKKKKQSVADVKTALRISPPSTHPR